MCDLVGGVGCIVNARVPGQQGLCCSLGVLQKLCAACGFALLRAGDLAQTGCRLQVDSSCGSVVEQSLVRTV